jgi:hypothetical protein
MAKRIKEAKEQWISDFNASFQPFGWQDVNEALDTINLSKINEGQYIPDFLFTLIEDTADDYGMEISELDPVATVYEYILEYARDEIERAIGFDFINDSNARTSIYVAGNYMATSYDYSEDALQELLDVLTENGISKKSNKFSEPTIYFLDDVLGDW